MSGRPVAHEPNPSNARHNNLSSLPVFGEGRVGVFSTTGPELWNRPRFAPTLPEAGEG